MAVVNPLTDVGFFRLRIRNEGCDHVVEGQLQREIPKIEEGIHTRLKVGVYASLSYILWITVQVKSSTITDCLNT